jgi:Protein of unknown function (DUF3037)
MQEKNEFEYAVVRVVPQVEREEFLNVGVVLFCAKQHFLQMRYSLNEIRLQAFCPKADIEEIQKHLDAFEQICRGDKEAVPIGNLSMPERFRWLTATRSTVVQTSKVHPGLCDDAAAMLEKIYREQVG